MVPHLVCLSILLSLFTLLFNTWARAEFYTATAELEALLETHKRIKEDLDDYIMKEEKRLADLKNHLEHFKVEHKQAIEDKPNYLENPLNAFILIKRLTIDLDEIYDSIRSGIHYIQNASMNQEDVIFPTVEDLVGAAQALTRLQVTYQLDVHDLAEGRLNGVAYSHPMTAADCFELCKAVYVMKDFKNLLAWSKETLRKFKEETKNKHSFTEVEVLEYIAYAHYKINDLKNALEWSKKLLQLDPTHPWAADNVPHFEKVIAELDTGAGITYKKAKPGRLKQASKKKYPTLRTRYEALCRGEMDVNSDVANRLVQKQAKLDQSTATHFLMVWSVLSLKCSKDVACIARYVGKGEVARDAKEQLVKREPTCFKEELFCRYMFESHPFLRLAPIKAEQVYIDPDVFVFHGVLSDDEIHTIKVLSTPRWKRAMFGKPGKLEAKSFRICKVAWLRDEESQVVARVSQRVADMTGLTMMSAEELQVVNYGIGGHYEPHYDFTIKDKEPVDGENRIATVLFYMSDVLEGGATVFTELGLSVSPARGAALYWRNLHPSGEGDSATRHAACPVLRGSKWVCNKWLHQIGQELIKPCNLEYQGEILFRRIPRAVPKSSP